MQGVNVKLNPALPWQKQHSTRRLFTSKLDLNLRKNFVKFYICRVAFYDAETWTLWKTDQKCLECFEMWYCRRVEKINWTDRVKNEVLCRVKEERNILHAIKTRKAN
jgi:hypothetical protein